MNSSYISVTLSDLLELARPAKSLSFCTSRVKAIHAGQHVLRILGRGMEFAETRQYRPGDDIRMIDWKVTARTGKTHTKLFAAEKEKQVVLLVDMRSSMFFATSGVFKSVQAAKIAGYVAWSAVHEENRVGGIVFNDSKCCEIRPKRGKKGALYFLQTLADQSCKSFQNTGQPKGLDEAISHLSQVTEPGSLVFVISDFRLQPPNMTESFSQIARHSDVVLCFLSDPIEEALPKNLNLSVRCGGQETAFSTSKRKSLDMYQKQFLARKESVEQLSQRRHIHFIPISTQDNCYEVLWKSFH